MKKYIVREGDTMWEISQATGVRLNLLMAANPQITDPGQLQPGSLIVIPELGKHGPPVGSTASTPPEPPLTGGMSTGPASTSAQEVFPPGAAVSEHTNIQAPHVPGPHPEQEYYFGFVWPHVVRAGETWEVLSNSYGVPINQLKRMNPELTKAPLSPGQVVYVPSPAAPPTAGLPTTGASVKPAVGKDGLTHKGMPGPIPPYSSDMQNGAAGPVPPGPQADEYGPHTHNPYRIRTSQTQPGAPYYSYSLPTYPVSAWYNDWEDSSSWEVDDATSGSLDHHG